MSQAAAIADQELERLATSVGIPPCPAILVQLAMEAKKDDPDLRKIERLVNQDVGLSAMLLKTINSPFYGLRHKVSTVTQAINLLGLATLSRMISGLVLRRAFATKEKQLMEKFWDASAKLALASSFIAKSIPGISKDEAYTYGLFQNCGMPVLLQRFPGYKETLAAAESQRQRKFTEVEDAAHGTHHATMGYLLAKSWMLPEAITEAIRHHHDPDIMFAEDGELASASRNLAAVGICADQAIAHLAGMDASADWESAGGAALDYLGLAEVEFDEIVAELKEVYE